MGLIWADKLALFLWAAIMAFLTLASAMGGPIGQSVDWWAAFADIAYHVGVPVLVVWIFLRIVDLILGGPRRRRASHRTWEGWS